jgi:hypothetical protein
MDMPFVAGEERRVGETVRVHERLRRRELNLFAGRDGRAAGGKNNQKQPEGCQSTLNNKIAQ